MALGSCWLLAILLAVVAWSTRTLHAARPKTAPKRLEAKTPESRGDLCAKLFRDPLYKVGFLFSHRQVLRLAERLEVIYCQLSPLGKRASQSLYD